MLLPTPALCRLLPAPTSSLPLLHPQIKGIISGRAGKASKRVFTHGLTSITTLKDCVDYAQATATTKNGHLGIKVSCRGLAGQAHCVALVWPLWPCWCLVTRCWQLSAATGWLCVCRHLSRTVLVV